MSIPVKEDLVWALGERFRVGPTNREGRLGLVDRQGRERGRLEGPVDWASDAALAAVRRLVG